MRCQPGIRSQNYPVTWNYENRRLPDNADVVGTVLVVQRLTKENQGQYFCEVHTPTGTLSDYVYLEVSGK